jgi:hypothetical protein
VYVCAGASGDGTSAADPHGSIASAVTAAPNGAVILIAAGRYSESVRVDRTVSLIGAGAAASHIEPPAGVAIRVSSGQGVVIRGLRLAGGDYGVLATNARVTLASSVVSSAARVGVRISKGAVAIIDDNKITGNAAGILVDEAGATATDPVKIQKSDVGSNTVYGIMITSSVAIIDDNKISANGSLNNKEGHGVIATTKAGLQPANVTITKNTIDSNLVTGVMLDSGALGIIDDNKIDANGKQEGLQGAGIWLQAGAGGPSGVQIKRNSLASNGYAGIGVGGGFAIIDDNKISGVPKSKLTLFSSEKDHLGDAVFIGEGARASVAKNQLSSCFRAGVMANKAMAMGTSITGNTINGNALAVVLQGQTGGSIDTAGNTISGNKTSNEVQSVSAGTFSVLDTSLKVPASAVEAP